MKEDDRPGYAKQSILLAHEGRLRAVLLEIYSVDGWAGVLRSVTKIQQEIGHDMKGRGRQGEGGWIF